MSDQMQSGGSMTGGPAPQAELKRAGQRWLPTTVWGWWSVGLTVVLLLVLFVALPLRIDVLPFLPDSWVGAVVMMVMIDAIAAVGLVAYIRKRERALVALLALIASVAIGLFMTLSVVIGGITGQ